MAEVDRCPTGIPGFDDLIQGGVPRGRSVLVAGTCGTGKTTFAVQFLCNGATKFGEPGIFVTLEQSADEIRRDMLHFGLDLKKLEDEGKLILIDTSLSRVGLKDYVTTLPVPPKASFSLLPGEFDMSKIVELTIQAADRIKAKRIVIDSLPALDVLVKGEFEVRKALINMNYEFKSNNLTTMLISELGDEEEIPSRHGIEEYVADGVIILKTNEALDTRTLKVRKMRVTKHTLKPNTLELNEKGCTVKPPSKKSLI